MPDSLGIPGKFFMGTKKKTKNKPLHTHTQKQMLPALTEREEQELLMVERE